MRSTINKQRRYKNIEKGRQINMYCQNCGKLMPEDAKFCVGCGDKCNVPPKEVTTSRIKCEKCGLQKDDVKMRVNPDRNYSKGTMYLCDACEKKEAQSYTTWFIIGLVVVLYFLSKM